MRRRASVLPALAAVVAVALASAGAAGAAPGMPKLTVYKATLDLAGYVHVRQTHDDTADCRPGRDLAIDYDLSVELGKPRPVRVTVYAGLATTTFARNPGGAVHGAELASYTETNYCPPDEPLGAPECVRRAGTLNAFLSPPPGTDPGSAELEPLGHPVSLNLMRLGGGNQDADCLRYLAPMEPSVGDHVIDVLAVEHASLMLPLGVTDHTIRRLGKGESIKRTIKLNGGCHHILVSQGPSSRAAAPRASDGSCTVAGKVVVMLRRKG